MKGIIREQVQYTTIEKQSIKFPAGYFMCLEVAVVVSLVNFACDIVQHDAGSF